MPKMGTQVVEKKDKDMLKQALIILEDQLKEFETTVIDKNKQINQLTRDRISLESENKSLKSEVKKARSESNELKSLNAVLEQKLATIEETLQKLENDQDTNMTELQSEISKLMSQNQEVMEENDSLKYRASKAEEAVEHLESLVQALRIECRDQREDNSQVVGQYVREKTVNSQLEAELEEANARCESYRIQLESMNEEKSVLEFEKAESESKLKTMLQKQTELIDCLQTENEVLNCKRKKTLADRIFGREKAKEPGSMSPSPSSSKTSSACASARTEKSSDD